MTKITNANSVGLLQAAMKYQIQGLADLCVAHMERSLNRNNVCKILDEAVNFDIPSLKTSALYFLSNFTREVFKTEGFLSLSYTSLDLILGKIYVRRYMALISQHFNSFSRIPQF